MQLIRKRTAAIERVKKYLAETIEGHRSTFDKTHVRDFIDLYLKAQLEDAEQELFTGIKPKEHHRFLFLITIT